MSLTRSYARTAQEALVTVHNLKRLQGRLGLLFEKIGRVDRRAGRVEESSEFGEIQFKADVPSSSASYRSAGPADQG